jgi:3-oxoacyl-[acyl-carrier protein] reductase
MIAPKERKIALVTGGGSGIGAACVRALAMDGFQVAIHCNTSRAQAEALASDLPGEPFVLCSNLSTTDGVDQIYEELKDRGPLEVIVNNAGRVIDAPLFSAQISDFDLLVDTNMRSAWYLTKRLSRLMIRKRSGRIIQISSVVASTGNAGQATYAMTKAALNAFTKCLAIELGPYGILVNSIAPGFIATKMTETLPDEVKTDLLRSIPLGRMGNPEEIAEWVSFLSTKGTYATGSVYHVNGGLHAGG